MSEGRSKATYRLQSCIVNRIKDLTIGLWLKGGLFIYSRRSWSVLWSRCTPVELFGYREICANIVIWLLISNVTEGLSEVIAQRLAIRSSMLFEEASLVLRNHRLLLPLIDHYSLLLLLLLLLLQLILNLTHFFSLSLASFFSFYYNSKSI